MFEPLTQRRYLVPFKASRLPQQFTDVLVIGGGVAGLRAAIAAAEAGADVLLLTKDTVEQSNTWYAQGGIAAVLQPLDSVESHVHDTEIVGVGLCDEKAVRIVVEEGPKRVLELLQWGANFDKKAGNAARPGVRPGRRPQLRADPPRVWRRDRQGAGADADPHACASSESIRISENSFAIDLITDDGTLRRRARA